MCKTSWRATSANRRRRRLPFQATPRSERSRTSPRLVCSSVPARYFTTESFPFHPARFPFIFRTTCAPLRSTLFRDERNDRCDGNSYSSRDTRSTGSEPSGDVSILFLFFSFFAVSSELFIVGRCVRSRSPPWNHLHFREHRKPLRPGV